LVLKKEHYQCTLKFEELAAKLSKQNELETAKLGNAEQEYIRSELVTIVNNLLD
jgi:hypothetical protein